MLQPPKLKPKAIGEREEKGLFELGWFRALLVSVVLGFLVTAAVVIDPEPDLSHMDVAVLSGSKQGNYHALVERLVGLASDRNGRIRNTVSRGSLDNLSRLLAARKSCSVRFGLVQDGIKSKQARDLKLIAQLPVHETALLLGRNADRIRLFRDLQGKKIGIGPRGSGTARLAEEIFKSQTLSSLRVRLRYHSIREQLKLLRSGQLDLGFFVIAESSRLVTDAVRRHGLQIAGLDHADAIAQHLPFLKAGTLSAGYYDPVRVLPPTNKRVLRVQTLILGNDCASRSETIALLQLLSAAFPSFINHNAQSANTTGLAASKYARSFFENRGPEILDEYAPWLVDWVPLGSLVQLVMAISILFNVMGAGNRFRLWRIDAARVTLENDLAAFFGADVLISELARLEVTDEYRVPERAAELDALVTRFKALKRRCRKHSVSMLVPMGQEMSYRYQESLLQERLDALNLFRRKFDEVQS